MTPAAAAWRHLKDARQDGFLQRKITVLCEDLKYIMKTAPRKKPYREDSVENQELKGELVQLQAQLRKFKEEVLPS